MNRPTIVTICGDPGGGAAIAPVIRRLIDDARVTVRSYAYVQSCDVLRKQDIPYEQLNPTLDAAGARRLLAENRASFLLTSTSVNGLDLEKKLIAAAKALKVPSLAVLDFWSNYRTRFADPAGRLSFVPDQIAVMNEQARTEMIAEGLPPEKLIVTGQPVFDDLADWKQSHDPALESHLRSDLGVAPEGHLVLFASQPLSELYGSSPASPTFLGFTELEVIRLLVKTLEGIAVDRGSRITLLIRPHPRESLEKFAAIRSDQVQVRVSSEGQARAIAMTSDLVVGMNTVLLVEACCLGCITVSLQPGLRGKDMLPTNAANLSRAIYDAAEVRPVIEGLLLDPKKRSMTAHRLSAAQLAGGAAHRMTERVYNSLRQQRLPFAGRLFKATAKWLMPPGIWNLTKDGFQAYRKRQEFKTMQPVLAPNRAYKDLHLGETCFILGTGPSIAQQDLKVLRGRASIALNFFYFHPDFGTVAPKYSLYTGNHVHRIGLKRGRDIYEQMAQRISHETTLVLPYSDYYLYDEFRMFKNHRELVFAMDHDWVLDTENALVGHEIDATKPICETNNSAGLAILLAIYMGFKKIYLLGLDHDQMLSQRPDKDWEQFYKGEKDFLLKDFIRPYSMDWERVLRDNWYTWREYKVMRAFAEKLGIAIVNATHGGMLDVFPREPFETVVHQS